MTEAPQSESPPGGRSSPADRVSEPVGAHEHADALANTDPAPPAQATSIGMSAWGKRAARTYLIVCGLALLAMFIETLLGHPGTATIFAALLAVPWSMLASKFLPALPEDWPLPAGLAIRMVPLALFMLLNAAIVAGIAARSERDLRSSHAQR